MIELWEMSDGQIWQITHDFGQVSVQRLLSDNTLSTSITPPFRYGDPLRSFDNEHDLVRFAAKLKLSVTFKVRGD